MKEVCWKLRIRTAIVSTPTFERCRVMSDRIAIMNRGKILKLASVKELIPKGKTLEQVFIETIETHQ